MRYWLVIAFAGCTHPGVREPAPPAGLGEIRGVVRDRKDGAPLPGVTVCATAPGTDELCGSSAITDDHGLYALDLTPGRYVITFFDADPRLRIFDVSVERDRVTPIDVQIAPEARPRGDALHAMLAR